MRSDDPQALREIIQSVLSKTKERQHETDGNVDLRIQVMVDMMVGLKNNRKRNKGTADIIRDRIRTKAMEAVRTCGECALCSKMDVLTHLHSARGSDENPGSMGGVGSR